MASIVSNVQQYQQCCRTGLVDVAGAHVQQAVCSRRSACQASKHADGKPMSAARQHKHTCFNPAALVAHGASSSSSCPIPPAVSIPGLERHVLGHHERTRPSFDTKPSTSHDHSHALDGQGGQERRVAHAPSYVVHASSYVLAQPRRCAYARSARMACKLARRSRQPSGREDDCHCILWQRRVSSTLQRT